MEPDEQIYRYDLYISCHGSERVSPNFTIGELAARTEKEVRNCRKFLRTKPGVFFKSNALGGNIDSTVEAILQTRPNGVVLFLITPAFFSERRCDAEFRAFREVQSDPEVNLKLIVVCLGFEDSILSASVEKQLRGPSYFAFRTDITITSIQATSACLCEVVFEAFKCSKNLSPQNLPTVVGRTRRESFLALQTVFTVDDLPTIRNLFSLHRNVTNLPDAFIELRQRDMVTQNNVEGLKEVIRYQSGPTAGTRVCMVQAYEQKWDLSHRLDWGADLRVKLSHLMENKANDSMRGASSSRHRETVEEFKPFNTPQLLRNVVLDSESCYDNPATTEGHLFDLEEPRTSDELLKEDRILVEGGVSSSETEVFCKYFDTPEIPQNVVLNYTACDENGDPVTAEGRLKREVISLSCGGDAKGVSAVGSHGMGGVGKTTALRGLCYDDEVIKAYPDGIYFLEFGQNASDQKVRVEVQRCVTNSGGKAVSEEIEKAGSLSRAIELASVWLRERKMLMVCDDLWPIESGDLGYVRMLKKLLRDARKSVLLISTRSVRIAESVGKAIPFESLEVRGEKARKILLKAAFGEHNAAEIQLTNMNLDGLLDLCDGLPLTLAIAGAGVKSEFKRREEASSAIERYCERLERWIERNADIELPLYPCLSHVIKASLDHCKQWQKDMQIFFQAFCVLEKQAAIPISSLSRFWRVSLEDATDIVQKFEEASLVRVEPCGKETGVRLHDLVLKLCQGMALGGECRPWKWHKRLCESYLSATSELRAWWDVENDSYIMTNLSQHLVEGGRVSELQALLFDVRWLCYRKHTGGWMAWEIDLKRLINATDKEKRRGIKQLHLVLERCWPTLGQSEFAFQVYGHLSKTERCEPNAARLLDSIARYYPKPWLQPLGKCMGPRDGRELSRWHLAYVKDMSVCWATECFVIAAPGSIIVWSMKRNELICLIDYDASSVAVSADGNLIVSGSVDKTVRRWDAHTGESIGEPLRGHLHVVMHVTVGADGNMIVSGSRDATVRRWDAHTGRSIGKPLRGHKGSVHSVALSADGKLIVSAGCDETVRRWDVQTGKSIGKPLRGHNDSVNHVAVSADGNLIVSGSADMTVRRWDAHTGESIGEPLRGHLLTMTHVAVSADGKLIVTGSGDETVRRWDAHAGQSIDEPLRGHDDWVSCLAVSPDGKLIISGSDDGTVRRWDAHTGQSIGESLRGHQNWVRCVAVSPDGKLIVSGSNDKTVRRWDAHTGESIGEPLHGHLDTVTHVAVSSNGKLIISESYDGTVRRWDAHTGQSISESAEAIKYGDLNLKKIVHPESYFNSLALLPSTNTCFAVHADTNITVVGLTNGCVAVCTMADDRVRHQQQCGTD